MALADYEPPKAEIACPGGVSFTVRALSLSDLSAIIRIHRDAAEEIVTAIRQYSDSGDTVEATVAMAMTMITESPALLATVISFAADEPDKSAQARDLPMAVSVDALNHVGELTFTDMAALKKMIDSVKQLMGGLIPPQMIAAAA